MRLLDNPLERKEKASMLYLLDGSINRICVSENIEEIVAQLGFAVDRLNMIAYSRIKELQIKE